MCLSFSGFSNLTTDKSNDRLHQNSNFTVDCDKLLGSVYDSAVEHGASQSSAQSQAEDAWQNCVDDGGDHAGTVAPVNIDVKLD